VKTIRDMIRRFYFVLFLFSGILSTELVFAQCNSSVKASAEIASNELGEIKVDISTSERFVCTLNTVSGKGIEKVNSQNGSGSKAITFSDLDVSKIYQIEVEFTTEENKLCSKLQRNDLVFE
jgi:hypothetical protein